MPKMKMKIKETKKSFYYRISKDKKKDISSDSKGNILYEIYENSPSTHLNFERTF